MTFTFSIRQNLLAAWHTYVAHPVYFIALSLIMIGLNMGNRIDSPVITALLLVVALICSYVWLSVSLAAADERHDLLTFAQLRTHLPTLKDFFMIIFVGLAAGAITLVGLIALIIPGIYFLVRLTFANLAYVDRKKSVKDAIQHSWQLVTGKRFWTVFLVTALMVVGILVGAMIVVVGLALTYPIALILQARLYRALDAHKGGAVIVQPKELTEHTA